MTQLRRGSTLIALALVLALGSRRSGGSVGSNSSEAHRCAVEAHGRLRKHGS